MTRLALPCILLALAPLIAAAQAGVEAIEGTATVVTRNADPERCLSAVAIMEIDGEAITARTYTFKLAPGLHSMNGRVTIDTRACPVAPSEVYLPVPDLVADFEAGKTYHVGLDHSSANSNDWRLVIWKTEDGETAASTPGESAD